MEMYDANGNISPELLLFQWRRLEMWALYYYPDIVLYIRDHQQGLLMLGGAIAFVLLVHWWDTKYERRRRWNLRRGKTMNSSEREAYLDSLMADIICDGIENAIHDGKMSDQEAGKRYIQFAKRFQLKDLMPRSNKKQQAKLKATLAKKWLNGKPKEAVSKQPAKNKLHAIMLKHTQPLAM
jgi:hypothetical protein